MRLTTLCSTLLMIACIGPMPEPTGDHTPAIVLPVDKALFDATWPVEVLDDATLNPLLNNPAYIARVGSRDYPKAVELSGGSPGLITARLHADGAALYRQAALASGRAYVRTYAIRAVQTDPKGTAVPVMVGRVLSGELEEAKAAAALVSTLEDEQLKPWAAPWLSWIQAGATWPPDLSTHPSVVPESAPGTWPVLDLKPSYKLAEPLLEGQEKQLFIQMHDPTVLLRLAWFHEEAARKAAGPQAELVDQYGARYRLALEPQVTSEAEMPLEMRYGSDYLHSLDGAFMAAVRRDGSKAVEAWKDRSFVAQVAFRSRVSGGKMDPQKAADTAHSLRQAWEKAANDAWGAPRATDRVFANVATAGLLRNLALVAEACGEHEASGILRNEARDAPGNEAESPDGIMALVAYDAGNGKSTTAAELTLNQSRRDKNMEFAFTTLQLLDLREQRIRGGSVGQ